VGHERTLANFLEEHAREVASASHFSESELHPGSRSDSTAAAGATHAVGVDDTKKAKRIAALTIEVRSSRHPQKQLLNEDLAPCRHQDNTSFLSVYLQIWLQVQAQAQLARNWLDALLRRFPEIALSVKTKKAARLLLSGERHIVERMGHEGVLEESEVSPHQT